MRTKKRISARGTLVSLRISSSVYEAAKLLAPYIDDDYGVGTTATSALRFMLSYAANELLSHYKLPQLHKLRPETAEPSTSKDGPA